MSLNSGETLQPFKPLNQLIYDSAGNLIGIQNDRANGSDLRIGGGSGVDGTFATLVATTALKLNSGATFDLYNTAGQTTNYERLRVDYSSNVARVWTQYGGSASARQLQIGTSNSAGAASPNAAYFTLGATAPFFTTATVGSSVAGVTFFAVSLGSHGASSGTQTSFGISPTINQSGTAGYTALDVNPTETATGSGTKLLQRWAVGGSTQAQMNAAGTLWLSYVAAINNIGFTNSIGSANDVTLTRDAADTLALRRDTNAQTFRVYNTYTDASNYERLAFAWGSNIATISTDAAGTGTVRWLRLNGATLSLMSGGTQRWNVSGSGHFLAEADNTYDIGASGANRPRAIYVADTIYSNATRLTQAVAVGSLPGAAASPYTRRLVNDSTVAMAGNYGAIVAGGGANIVPVFSDGTNWRIG